MSTFRKCPLVSFVTSFSRLRLYTENVSNSSYYNHDEIEIPTQGVQDSVKLVQITSAQWAQSETKSRNPKLHKVFVCLFVL